jgi:RNA polymerase sigma-70 factor (ECF subfamily)
VATVQRVLVERARNGELEAFTQLVRVSLRRLTGVANLILRDSDLAQDAVQDACLMAWRDLRALREPDAWDAWLHRLTVRACYKVSRKERRHSLVELHVTPGPRSVEGKDISTDVVDRDWLGRELGRLDLDQRAVLVLHYYLDLPVSEVAEILDIPYGTAASRLHRGLEALRASMRPGSEADSDLVREQS